MNNVRHVGSPAVCPNGTTHGTTIRPSTPESQMYQNQSQNQTVLKSVLGIGYVSHASSLCEGPRLASMHACCAGEIR
jgi:hypothetical protein